MVTIFSGQELLAGPRLGASQHGDLEQQHERFRALDAAEEDQPAAEPDEDQMLIIMAHGHASPIAPGHSNRPAFGSRQPVSPV
jgi:hypothetical protein